MWPVIIIGSVDVIGVTPPMVVWTDGISVEATLLGTVLPS